MHRIGVIGTIVVAGMAGGAAAFAKGGSTSDAFAFLAPPVQLTPSTLTDGQVFVKVLPGRGNELAMVAATRTTAAPARLIAWMRRVDLVQRGRYVSNVGRLSNPPTLDDLADTGVQTDYQHHPPDAPAKRHPRHAARACDLQTGLRQPLQGRRRGGHRDHRATGEPVPGVRASVDVDVLDGIFGGLVRRIIEQRVREEAPGILTELRLQLESGDPPQVRPHVRRKYSERREEIPALTPGRAAHTTMRSQFWRGAAGTLDAEHLVRAHTTPTRRTIMTESITRILVPVDFSAHSDRALRYAATLAGQVGASVELLHVVEDITYGAFSEIYVPNMPDLVQELINDGIERLTSLKAAAFPHGADVDIAVFVGRPAAAIPEHAKAGGFDLIVMGTHGRTGLSHVFMGSVAERVVRTAPCAVLTVRGTDVAAASKPAAPAKAA